MNDDGLETLGVVTTVAMALLLAVMLWVWL